MLNRLALVGLLFAAPAYAQQSMPTASQGSFITFAQPVVVLDGSGNPVNGSKGAGTDASGSAPTIGNVLTTFTVTVPGAYYVQNQSAVTLQVIFDDGTNTPTVQLLGPGAGAGSQGADTSPPMPWFTGRVRVAGTAGSQFAARYK